MKPTLWLVPIFVCALTVSCADREVLRTSAPDSQSNPFATLPDNARVAHFEYSDSRLSVDGLGYLGTLVEDHLRGQGVTRFVSPQQARMTLASDPTLAAEINALAPMVRSGEEIGNASIIDACKRLDCDVLLLTYFKSPWVSFGIFRGGIHLVMLRGRDGAVIRRFKVKQELAVDSSRTEEERLLDGCRRLMDAAY